MSAEPRILVIDDEPQILRALRTIIEELMLDVMFEVPSNDQVTRCTISRETVEQRQLPLLTTAGVLIRSGQPNTSPIGRIT